MFGFRKAHYVNLALLSKSIAEILATVDEYPRANFLDRYRHLWSRDTLDGWLKYPRNAERWRNGPHDWVVSGFDSEDRNDKDHQENLHDLFAHEYFPRIKEILVARLDKLDVSEKEKADHRVMVRFIDEIIAIHQDSSFGPLGRSFMPDAPAAALPEPGQPAASERADQVLATIERLILDPNTPSGERQAALEAYGRLKSKGGPS